MKIKELKINIAEIFNSISFPDEELIEEKHDTYMFHTWSFKRMLILYWTTSFLTQLEILMTSE